MALNLTGIHPTSPERDFRSTKAALVCDQETKSANPTWRRAFESINISVLSSSEFAYMSETSEGFPFDIVGLLGSPGKITADLGDGEKELETRIAFVPARNFLDCKNYLEIADAAVVCETSREKSTSREDCWQVAHDFFGSITVPSMLNIDLADLRNIARGIGVAYRDSDDSSEEIIRKLPEISRLARSALLHFSCAKDVTLKEIYSISKGLAWRSLSGSESPGMISISSTNDKLHLRKLNIKMGIRIEDRDPSGQNERAHRISITAILFGIRRRDFQTKRFGLI